MTTFDSLPFSSLALDRGLGVSVGCSRVGEARGHPVGDTSQPLRRTRPLALLGKVTHQLLPGRCAVTREIRGRKPGPSDREANGRRRGEKGKATEKNHDAGRRQRKRCSTPTWYPAISFLAHPSVLPFPAKKQTPADGITCSWGGRQRNDLEG